MRYAIRLLYSDFPPNTTDILQTKDGWERWFGQINKPRIFNDINEAYRQLVDIETWSWNPRKGRVEEWKE